MIQMKKIVPLLTLLVGLLSVNTASAQCKADFSFYTNGNGTFVFVDSSGNTYTSDHWDFGDGNSSNSTSGQVSHTYNRMGTFTVCRTVWDSIRSCRDTFCTTVSYTSTTCKALFTYSVSGDSVQFADNSTNAVYHSWDFGDGKSSASTNPLHVYKTPGTYTVCLTILDSLRTCTDRYCLTVVVSQKCDASWTASMQNLTVGFRLNSTNSGRVDYRWTFGNGDSSRSASPVYTYAKPGTYVVCLEMYDSAYQCYDYHCDSLYVDTTNTTRCQVFFSATVSGDTLVNLTNWSTGFTHFIWTFPNGDTSNYRHESMIIKKPGTYTFCLVGKDSVTGCTDTLCKTVTIDSAKNCRASFRIAVDTSQKFKLFLINGSSNKSSHQYYWTFGDGGTSTQRNPTHKYTSFGKYNVCLTVYDSTLNCTATYCDSLGLDSTGRLLKANGFELEVIDDFLSAPTVENIEFTIFPNPTTSAVSVKLAELKGNNAYAKVYNLQGELVQEALFNTETLLSLDLSQDVDGLYLIHLFDGKNHVQTKLIKMNK